MQYVNDDMDELFRRAAENYPLDTSSADWNKVLGAMQGQGVSQPVTEKGENKKRHFLWLLLLLPVGLICNQLYTPASKNVKGGSGAITTKSSLPLNNVTDKDSKPVGRLNNSSVTIENSVVTTTNTNEEVNRNGKINDNKQIADPSYQKISYDNKHTNKKISFSSGSQDNKKKYDLTSEYSRQGSPNSITHHSVETDFLLRQYVSEILFKRNVQLRSINLTGQKLSPIKNPNGENAKQNFQAGRRQNKFYAGIVGGIDATTVKFQKIEDKGYDYGFLLGYQLNKKWAIETGLYMANKYYYTDGKYLDVSKIYPNRPNWWIEDASGDCRMIEVPISVKYNFSSGKNSSWFSTLGTSSYFMKEEKYTYETYYGTSGPWPHNDTIKNSSKNLFSNISISGGYIHKIGNIGDLRIEPYLKIPVSKMGAANLPLLSTGVHIGITRKF